MDQRRPLSVFTKFLQPSFVEEVRCNHLAKQYDIQRSSEPTWFLDRCIQLVVSSMAVSAVLKVSNGTGLICIGHVKMPTRTMDTAIKKFECQGNIPASKRQDGIVVGLGDADALHSDFRCKQASMPIGAS